MNGLFRRLNLRHLAGRRLRTLLTVSGIAAGVALFFSISVINQSLLESFRSSMRDVGGKAEIEVAASNQVGLRSSAVRQVASLDGVDQAVPALRATARVKAGDRSERALILGITPEFSSLFPQDVGPFGSIRVAGGFGGEGEGLLISERLATELELEGAGRAEDVVVSVETPTGPARVPVTGTIGGGVLAALNGGDVGLMLLPAAQQTFDKAGLVDSIYVVVDPDVDVGEVEAAIERRLGGSPVVGPPGERARGLERVFEGLGTLLTLSGTVALFVAMFVVFNTMSMALAERRREISMAMSFGATRRQVFGAFLAEAALLGVASAAVGIAGGYLLAKVLLERANQAYQVLPVGGAGGIVVEPAQIAIAAGGGVVVALIGAFVPARRVLRVAPIESLRPEASYEWGRTTSSRLRTARTVATGMAGIVLAAGFFVAFLISPDQGWIPVAGLVSGLTGITLLLPIVVPPVVAALRPAFALIFGTVGRLAADSLGRNPGRTTFTVAALVLTLGVAIGVGSALQSYQSQVESMSSSLIGAPLYVTARSYTALSSDQPLPLDLEDDIAQVTGVKLTYPIRSALINVRDEQGLIFAVPVKEALEGGADTHLPAITPDPDAFMDGLAAGEIAVSRLTAERYDLEPGDTFTLPVAEGRRSFEIATTFEDLIEFDSFYIDHDVYRRLWNDDKVDQFGVLVADDASVAEVRERLQGVVRERGVPARVFTQQELVGRILEVVEGTFSLGRGIQAAALIVAALTIANTMFTGVFERRWEMGLQRAVGMSGAQLGRAVVLEAAGIGLLGGIGGALLGAANGFLMVQAMEAQFHWYIPFVPPLALAMLAVAGGVAIAAGAGVLPSRLAIRAPIIESLRYE